MVDVHSHVLWGLDDGAETLEESIAMLALAAVSGTTDIVATPHANLRYRFETGLIVERIRELTIATGGRPRIHRGCDFHLTSGNVQDALRNPEKYTVNGGRYLLVEFPEASLDNMKPVLEALRHRGLIPIMTHPERHPQLRELNPDFEEWVGMGCLVQITAQSLMGRFGRRAEASAWEMLRRGMAHFVASDAHGIEDRTPRLDEAFAAVSQRTGRKCAEQLFIRNPAAVISGEAIQPVAVRRKAWFGFLR